VLSTSNRMSAASPCPRAGPSLVSFIAISDTPEAIGTDGSDVAQGPSPLVRLCSAPLAFSQATIDVLTLCLVAARRVRCGVNLCSVGHGMGARGSVGGDGCGCAADHGAARHHTQRDDRECLHSSFGSLALAGESGAVGVGRQRGDRTRAVPNAIAAELRTRHAAVLTGLRLFYLFAHALE